MRNRAISLFFNSAEPLFVKKYEHRTNSKLKIYTYLLFSPSKDLIESRDVLVTIAA